MNAILLVLRTGMQWNARDATGICPSSSAHRFTTVRPPIGLGWQVEGPDDLALG